MTDLKISIAIPYKQRLDNITTVFEGLANQTMDSAEFEVVVGAMEYSDEYTATCRRYSDRLNLVSVVSAQDFSIPRARNIAMRQASGRVLVQMDADTLLPPAALENLYERYFAFGQNVCVVGQVVGYDNNDQSVDTVSAQPYSHYQADLKRLGESYGNSEDPRFQVDHVVPWAFAWTGLIALPLAMVHAHGLYFDESFHGWGVDDLEWGYRIAGSGLPIVLREDVHAIHLPHTRDADANRETEKTNYRRFLRKWPRLDVELAHAFGDVEANSLYLGFKKELHDIAKGERLGTVRGTINGSDVVVMGVTVDERDRITDEDLLASFDASTGIDVLPLIGLALPYDDGGVGECRILPRLDGFSDQYRDAISQEAKRVAAKVLVQSGNAL